jgi:proline iminopeptidase
MASDLDSVTVDDGATLATTRSGPIDGRPMLLLHGGPGLWDYLQPVADLMPTDMRVHRFDQRGCAASTGHGDYRLERAVADIEALRRHWGHQRWSLFGHSYGASLALAYAWAHPDRIDRLIYCSGFGPGEQWRLAYRRDRHRWLTPAQRSQLDELARLPARDPAQETEFLTLSWTSDHADPQRAEAWAATDAAACPGVNYDANRILGAQIRMDGRGGHQPDVDDHRPSCGRPRRARPAARRRGRTHRPRAASRAASDHCPRRTSPLARAARRVRRPDR